MKWHKVVDELPPEFITVLVAPLNPDGEFDMDLLSLCYRSGNYWFGQPLRGNVEIELTDRWTYIELPED